MLTEKGAFENRHLAASTPAFIEGCDNGELLKFGSPLLKAKQTTYECIKQIPQRTI